jgi:hypothetical protein
MKKPKVNEVKKKVDAWLLGKRIKGAGKEGGK